MDAATVNQSVNSNNVVKDANEVDHNATSSDNQSFSASSDEADPAWDHVSLNIEGGRSIYTCLFCSNKYEGGGLNMMKQHLAGEIESIAGCQKVPLDVREQMLELLEEPGKAENKDKSSSYGDEIGESCSQEEEEEFSPTHPPSKVLVVGEKDKRKAKDSGYFAPRTTPGGQPSLKIAFQSKEALNEVDLRLARWMVDAKIPFGAIQSPYFKDALDAIAGVGPGYKGPSYDELRGHFLGELKKECQLLVDSYRSSWKEVGCTLMVDSWTDRRERTLINFLVYCPTGMCFIKSVDASDVVKNASRLCNMLTEVIEWVGPCNIVHVVTDNATNYVIAGKLIHEKYENIFWSPCAAQCLNLILKDIGSMPYITSLASRASKITAFIYNHMVFLSWLRKMPGWKEIVCPGPTRFATIFFTLKNIYEHKADLQALVVDAHFTMHKLGRSANGKAVSAIVLDNKFWDDCHSTCKLIGPLIILSKIVNSDEKPSLGFVYEGMQRAKHAMKVILGNKKIAYQPYIEIIKRRWDKHLKRSLHAAAYFLNPALFYDEQFIEKPQVLRSLLDLFDVKSLCSDSVKVMKEIQIYRNRKGSFDRPTVLSAALELDPSEWWRSFGGSAPNLQKIAIRMLSQTSFSLGCERNWSVFEQIHTKRRNQVEHQRLNDIVYVNYNLRLKSRLQQKKRSYDPIDYESIDLVDFWVTEEVKEPELPNDLQELIYQENSIPSYHVDDDETYRWMLAMT